MKAYRLLLPVCALLLVLSSSTTQIVAQELPGTPDSLYSEILGEQRAIQIVYPNQHEPESSDIYPVVYVLDGEWNTGHMEYIRNFLVQEKFIPNLLIVALPNTYINNVNQRDRDFLTKSPSPNYSSGEVEKFTKFLRSELIPYIEANYPAGEDRILFGHSHGGQFTVNTFLNNTDLFDAYLATDPSLQWGDQYFVKQAQEKLQDLETKNKVLWLAGISRTAPYMGISAIDTVFQQQAPDNLFWEIATYPNETHNSVRFKGIFDGLKFIFDGYNKKLVFHPMNGILMEGASTPLFTEFEYEDARYTTDGSDPTAESEPLTMGASISAPATVIAQSFSGNPKYAKTVTGEFTVGKPWPAVKKPRRIESGGLQYSYYEGSWTSLPDFQALKPISNGRTGPDFTLDQFPRTNDFGLILKGFFKAEQTGHYVFAMDSDDGSRLFIDGKMILEHDGLHGTGNIQSYILPLEEGFHPVRLEYFQAGQDRNLQVYIVTPDNQEPRPIPLEFQFSKKP